VRGPRTGAGGVGGPRPAGREVAVESAGVRERWFSKRAWLLHFLLVTVVPACLFAGWWQVHRALSGNLLSYFYSIEWPVFAVLAVVAWWQLVHDQPTAGEVEPEPGAGGQAIEPHPIEPAAAGGAATDGGRRRKSWFYHQDDFEGPRLSRDRAEESPELAEYNRYLQALAVGRARKTWGNPRGLPVGGPEAQPGAAEASRRDEALLRREAARREAAP
jgi:DNA-binding transcriptional regulator of glucitol operon